MFEKIRGFLMNILSLFHNYKIDEITGVKTNITSEMYNKIELWFNMMSGRAPWNFEAPSCGVLQQISGRLNYFVTREIGLDVENETIKKPLEHLNKNIDKIVEYIALLGGGLIRPLFSAGRLQYEAIPLGNYLPTKYDFDGTLTGAVILKQIAESGKIYLLSEVHDFNGTDHNVIIKLFRNDNGNLKPAPLTACEQTATLTPEYSWHACGRPMIVEFRNHATNKIDGSNVPVAMIAGAEDLIEAADRQFERMNWEQIAGEKRVFADRDMFRKRKIKDEDGNIKIEGGEYNKTLNRLITKIDGDGSANGDKIHEYSPELRTAAQNDFLQQIFRRIELTLNVGKGSVSDAEAVQQTATQYSGGRQELFAIVDKIEDEIESKYKDVAAIFAYMAKAYQLPGAPDPKADDLYIIKWNDDQTRKDITQAKQLALQEVNAGVRNKWEYRRDFYGEDEETAKANAPADPVANSPFDLM
ncbi:MAG: phage portal protein [Clostridia bacterium]|nr:phage portal protein [Clostridia bacterium]